MSIRNKLQTSARNIKKELKVYKAVIEDKRTPLPGKLIMGLAIGYFFLPFDIIPDFIPLIGHLDDLLFIPLLVIIALKLIPKEIVSEHRMRLKFA